MMIGRSAFVSPEMSPMAPSLDETFDGSFSPRAWLA